MTRKYRHKQVSAVMGKNALATQNVIDKGLGKIFPSFLT